MADQPNPLAVSLCKRWDTLQDQRRLWEPVWQELSDYILPRKNNIVIKRTPGAKQTSKLFDSTAPHAAQVLASSIHGALTNPDVKWFRLRTRNTALMESQEIRTWLEDCEARVYQALQQSNFNAVVNEFFIDLAVFGIGGYLIEEVEPSDPGFSGFRFVSMAPGEYAVSENKVGRVGVVFRKFEMPASAAVERWTFERVGEKIQQAYRKDPDQMVTILHATLPRAGGMLQTSGGQYIPFPQRWPVACYYVGWDNKILLSEEGYTSFPFAVARWTKTSGEIYGRGPGHIALPDVKSLNKARELGLKAWAKAIDPPLKVRDQGVVSASVRLTPAALNVVRQMDDIMPIDFKANFHVDAVKSQELVMSIKDIFFNNQIQLPNQQMFTATEVERRIELMQRVLGPTAGRIDEEGLAPTIERCFQIMALRGELEPPPPALEEDRQRRGSDRLLDIEYEGPLSKTQRNTAIASIERTISLVMPIAQAKPEAMDKLDWDGMVEYAAKSAGLPSTLILDAEKLKMIRDARAQAMEEAKQQESMLAQVEGASKLAPVLKAAAPGGVAHLLPGGLPPQAGGQGQGQPPA